VPLRLTLRGGVSGAEIQLPPASGIVPIQIASGVSRLALRRPVGTPVRLRLKGAATDSSFDAESIGAIGPGCERETADWATAQDRRRRRGTLIPVSPVQPVE